MQIQWPTLFQQQTAEGGKFSPDTVALRAGDQLTAAVLEVENGRDALLSLGQFKAYARMPVPVVSGQNVQIRVAPGEQGLRLLMVPQQGQCQPARTDTPLEIRMFEPVPERPLLSTHAGMLKAGETLEGRITGFEKDGLKLVDFGRFKAFTKIDFPVRQGQVVPLQVIRSGQEVALTLAPQARATDARGPVPPSLPPTVPEQANVPAQASPSMPQEPAVKTAGQPVTTPTAAPASGEIAVLRDQIRQLLEEPSRASSPVSTADLPDPMKKALTNLQQILSPASPGGDVPTLAARVRNFVENSGIYFEKRLAETVQTLEGRSGPLPPTELAEQPAIRNLMVTDLKPNLLVLQQFLDAQPQYAQAADRHLLETLKSVVQRAVSHIEQQQSGAAEKPVDPDVLQAFSHLLFLTDNPRNAQLKVYYARKGRDGENKKPRVSLLLEMDPMGAVRTDLWMVARDLNITFFVPNPDIQALIRSEEHRIGEALQPVFNTVAVNVVVNEKKIEAFDGEELFLPGQRQLDVSV
ncbi:hypothetical protein [uncultured Desulfosarcina sp.]|uniref:hypothetical protein n=1 Tax=uncultured Desulfosarcina sp. TaxID=218289 RepID=UPI0029C60323|nr:hypothetical protein [uncultured Desulfosarcina sp.]